MTEKEFCRRLREMSRDEAKAPTDYRALIKEGYPHVASGWMGLNREEVGQIMQIVREESRHGRVVDDLLKKVC